MGAAVLGDMSSRKDWGIHELDFVFSTVVVSCQRCRAKDRVQTSRTAAPASERLADAP